MTRRRREQIAAGQQRQVGAATVALPLVVGDCVRACDPVQAEGHFRHRLRVDRARTERQPSV